MKWADDNGHCNTLGSPDDARNALRAYFPTVRERAMRGEISLNTGAAQQSAAVKVLGDFLCVDDLSRGLNQLRPNQDNQQSTVPPGDTEQGEVLSIAAHIFDGLVELVLQRKPYPYSLTMPEFLALPGNRLWIFPTVSWFQTPAMRAVAGKTRCAQYNFEEGRLASEREMIGVPKGIFKLRTSQELMKAANTNAYHTKRRQAAMSALNMYLILFVAETAMNWAQVVNLLWSDDFEIEVSYQGFRTVKWRADGRVVSFELPVEAMPLFNRFLALRKYLLDGKPFEFLFFKRVYPLAPRPLRSPLGAVFLMLKRLAPSLERVLGRQWRAAKSDWLLRNTDPSTAAIVLQNTEKTVLASYAEGSATAHMEEMGQFLELVGSSVVPAGQVIPGGVTRAAGNCTSFGQPVSLAADESIAPDCRAAEGCLFCDKFKVHADETDVRKLLSCRFCLNQTSSLVMSEEQRNALFTPLFKRIESLLEEISKRDAALVHRVTKEVEDEGELDPYWARKFEMLVELGVAA